MPQYRFSNPSNPSEYIDIILGMNDTKEHIKENIKWNREYFVPLTAIDTKCDPYNPKDFIKVTNKKDTLGGIWDRSRDLGLKRKDKDGIDFVQQRGIKRYENRVKKPHIETIRANARKKLDNMGVTVG